MWYQLLVALGLGLYHHTDYEGTFPGNTTAYFRIGPPADFYGFAIFRYAFGKMLPNVFTTAAYQPGTYELGVKVLHKGILDGETWPWMWIEPGKELYVEFANLTNIAQYAQFTSFEVYFQTRDMMDLAKLAIREYFAPSIMNLGMLKNLVPTIMNVGKLPYPEVKP